MSKFVNAFNNTIFWMQREAQVNTNNLKILIMTLLVLVKIDETIKEHLGFFLDKFNFHISRSRVAYIFGYGEENQKDKGWHVDEPTCQLLRM